MAFKDGIFSMFGINSNGQANPAPNTPQPGAQAPNIPAPANGNGSGGPASQNPTGAPNGQLVNPANPLDGFMKLLTPSAEVIAAQKAKQTDPNAGYLPAIPKDQLTKMVSEANFTAGINPEVMKKAMSGDEASFAAVLNQVAQQAFSANLQLSQTLAEQAAASSHDRVTGSLDSRFRNMQIKSKVSENPALQHPMGQAMLNSLKSQIATANPQMSADEVHTAAEAGFHEFAALMVAKPANQQQADAAKSQTNWLDYLDSSTGDNKL